MCVVADELEATLNKGRKLLASSKALLLESRVTMGVIDALLLSTQPACLPSPAIPETEDPGAR